MTSKKSKRKNIVSKSYEESGSYEEELVNKSTLVSSNYEIRKFDDLEIVIMKKNGYVNCTKICSYLRDNFGSNKLFKNWSANTDSIEFITEIINITGLPKNKLMIVINGGQQPITRGTYCHPLLVTHIIYWASPTFSAKISLWIEEWKQFSNSNEKKYFKAIRDAKPSNNLQKEKPIQTKLQAKYGGVIEVVTAYGRIDLLTNKYIIEIKTYNDWKCSIGQIIVYSMEYPKKKRMIYLFDVPKKNIIDKIQIVCDQNDILLRFEHI